VPLVEVWRGEVIESLHLGAAVAADAGGEIIESFGDPALVTYPRSALKPVQAMLMAENGVFDTPGLDLRHVALAAASHSAQPFQVSLVREWLARLGLSESQLACGADKPGDETAAEQARSAGEPRAKAYHNCSGKHTGFLNLCRCRAWPVEGYEQLQHPAQQHYLDALSGLLGRDARGLPIGVDGCRLPAVAISLADFARAMARYAAARVPGAARARAIALVQSAMRRHPEYVSGLGQASAELILATKGRVLVKTGAEGFMMAMAPERGAALALKVLDGGARARFVALVQILFRLGWIDAREFAALRAHACVPVNDSAGHPVGRVQAALRLRS
jgi:L-asparaginase II